MCIGSSVSAIGLNVGWHKPEAHPPLVALWWMRKLIHPTSSTRLNVGWHKPEAHPPFLALYWMRGPLLSNETHPTVCLQFMGRD